MTDQSRRQPADGAAAGDGAAEVRTVAGDGERQHTGMERRRGRGPETGSGADVREGCDVFFFE